MLGSSSASSILLLGDFILGICKEQIKPASSVLFAFNCNDAIVSLYNLVDIGKP
jgi:hypothetical protein